MIKFTGPDDTVTYAPGTPVTFQGTLGPPTKCSRVSPGPVQNIALPPGLGANWSFPVTLPAAAGTYTYEVEAAGSKGDTRTLKVGPVAVPTEVLPGTEQ